MADGVGGIVRRQILGGQQQQRRRRRRRLRPRQRRHRRLLPLLPPVPVLLPLLPLLQAAITVTVVAIPAPSSSSTTTTTTTTPIPAAASTTTTTTAGHTAELLIFVENLGGQVLQENITTFGQHIVISYERPDSSAVTLWYDYANGVQAFRFVVSGEEELGQGGVSRTVCYATFFDRDSLVPVNAMYKLRQRNPHVIRFAELDRGREELYLDHKMATDSVHALSPQLAHLCADTEHVYTRQHDLQSWVLSKGAPKLSSLKATKVHLNPAQQVQCSSDPAPWAPCSCRLSACVLWYPCALRFCENSGICGIRTCSKCYEMIHTEEGRLQCVA